LKLAWMPNKVQLYLGTITMLDSGRDADEVRSGLRARGGYDVKADRPPLGFGRCSRRRVLLILARRHSLNLIFQLIDLIF
jgi:hypothetical protein